MAAEWMAAMTGLGDVSIRTMTWRSVGSARAAGVWNSRMSAPPLNSLPPPVMTMAATASSAIAASTSCASAFLTAALNPLTGGLSSVSTATSSRRSLMTVAMFSSLPCRI